MPYLRRLTIAAAAFGLAATLGACTQNDNGNNTLVGRHDSPTPTGGPQTTSAATGDGPVALEAKDNEFVPKEISAKAGDITIDFKNTGVAPHTFTAADFSVDQNVNAGQSTTLTLKGAKPGTYKFVCKYHESLGMTGTITVT